MNLNRRSLSYITEHVIRNSSARMLPILIKIHGTDYIAHRMKEAARDAKSSNIYGQHAGTNISSKSDEYTTHKVRILASPTFFSSTNDIFAGLIEEEAGYAFCYGDLRVDDIIQVVRTDNKITRFKVIDCQKIGHTIDIIYRFEISLYEQ